MSEQLHVPRPERFRSSCTMIRIFKAAELAIGMDELRRAALEDVPSNVVAQALMDAARAWHGVPKDFWRDLPGPLRSTVINELLFYASNGETITLPEGLTGVESAADLRVDQMHIPWRGIRYVRVNRDPEPMALHANYPGGDPASADELALDGFYLRRVDVPPSVLAEPHGIEITAFSVLPEAHLQRSDFDDNHCYLPLWWVPGERATLRELAVRHMRAHEHEMDPASAVNLKRTVDELLNQVIRALQFVR